MRAHARVFTRTRVTYSSHDSGRINNIFFFAAKRYAKRRRRKWYENKSADRDTMPCLTGTLIESTAIQQLVDNNRAQDATSSVRSESRQII